MARYGPALAAVAAAAAGLPALWVSFLSDDWANLAATADPFGPTPYGYYRPLNAATLLLDRGLWGVRPSLFHLTNILLVAAAAFLVVVLIQRYTGDSNLACLSGLLFAIHPYHVETVAWVSGRSDPLFAVCLLGAAIAYDRWRAGLRGLPIGALILFEAALLSKETAIIFPFLLIVVGWMTPDHRPARREWLHGLLPLMSVGLLHFVAPRAVSLGGLSHNLLHRFGRASLRNLLDYATVAILPFHPDVLAARPLLWWCAASVLSVAMLAGTMLRARGVPLTVWVSGILFLVLALPSTFAFQQRYFFLPSAATALALASLLLAMKRRSALVAGTLLCAIWAVASIDLWMGWREAGTASDRLVEDLVRASRDPGVDTVVVVNMPRRVHGAPVGMEFDAAVAVSRGRPVKVEFIAYVDYATARADDLVGSPEHVSRAGSSCVGLELAIPDRLYSRYVFPVPDGDDHEVATPYGDVVLADHRHMRVTCCPAPQSSIAFFVWRDGMLGELP